MAKKRSPAAPLKAAKATKRGSMPPARTAAQLWSAATERGGLQPRLRPRGLAGYDTAFAAEVAAALGLEGRTPTIAALRRRGTTIEDMLGALLRATLPWAGMMSDVLEMFEEAGAAAGDDRISLELNLSKLAPPLAQSLAAFRRQAVAAGKVTMQVPGTNWAAIDLFGLRPDNVDLWTLRRDFPVNGTSPMLEWAEGYFGWPRHQPGGRDVPPSFRATGFKAFDVELSRLHKLLSSFVAAVRAWAPTYQARMASWQASELEEDLPLGGGWTVQDIAGPESDFFPAVLAEIFERIAWHPELDGPRAESLALELKEKLDLAPPGPPIERLVEQYLDLLDLPAWQRRHELYSVWVSCIIARALPQDKRWELVGGTLSYAFAGARLISGSLGSAPFELWAEHRSALPKGGSGKRKKAVQPDYTLLTKRTGAEPRGALVVECKQYRTPSRRNFRDALQDYALAHPLAPVLLVNYGPVPEGLGEDLGNESGPVAAFGDVRPGGAGLAEFEDALGRGLTALAYVERQLRPEAEAATHERALEAGDGPGSRRDRIWLEWDSDADLDLHVGYIGAGAEPEISYCNRGSLTEHPFMWLDQDVTLGPGRETVWIGTWLGGRYEVAVELYRGEWPAHFEIGISVGGVTRTLPLSNSAGRRLTALRIDGNMPELTLEPH